jgi:hypothetical protein
MKTIRAGAVLGLTASLAACDPASAAKWRSWWEDVKEQHQPPAPPSVPDERLVVADTTEHRLYVYDVATLTLVADLPNVAMADHPGFLPLNDGRLLFVDSALNALQIARIHGTSKPSIERSIPLLGQAAHIAVDPSGKHAVVSTNSAYDDGRGALTLVTLADGTYQHVPLATGEPGVAVTADPITVIHRNDAPAQLEMYAYDELLEGTAEPLDVAAIGLAPHGEVIAHARGKVVSATARGIDIASFDALGFGEVKTVPYDVDGFSGGRAFYARLSGDGRYLYSYLRDDRGGEAPWGEWRSDGYIVDLETQTARRIPVGNGLVYRLGVCETLAAFTQYAPQGDALHLLDARQGSPTFQQLIAKIPLERMSQAPGVDGDVWSSEAFRITALSSDCAHAFVTHGGDGKISIIDTASARVERILETPTRLAHGGYLISMRRGQALVDTIGR